MKTTQERNGRWSAEIPGVAQSYGATRGEAIAGVTVRALRVVADRIEHSRLPFIIAGGEEVELERIQALAEELVAALTGVPTDETLAAMKELEDGGGESFESFEDLIAKLNAD